MTQRFDPGYSASPFRELVEAYPGTDVYPHADFRTEWGPVFHRGRLDGSARVLVIGQDPAQHENITRRILVGEAGHRIQGLLAKLGIDASYVMINTFLFSLRRGSGGSAHRSDLKIAAYRNAWLNALMLPQVEAVIALGALADGAWTLWRATSAGQGWSGGYAHITHPTQPSSAAGRDRQKLTALTKALLVNWNAGIDVLAPAIAHPDHPPSLAHYKTTFRPADLAAIPAGDLPAGSPAWMRQYGAWADRGAGRSAPYTITITVPPNFR